MLPSRFMRKLVVSARVSLFTFIGAPLSVELGPGLIEAIYDGIQSALDVIEAQVGNYTTRGVEAYALDREKKWRFRAKVNVGDQVAPGIR